MRLVFVPISDFCWKNDIRITNEVCVSLKNVSTSRWYCSPALSSTACSPVTQISKRRSTKYSEMGILCKYRIDSRPRFDSGCLWRIMKQNATSLTRPLEALCGPLLSNINGLELSSIRSMSKYGASFKASCKNDKRNTKDFTYQY